MSWKTSSLVILQHTLEIFPATYIRTSLMISRCCFFAFSWLLWVWTKFVPCCSSFLTATFFSQNVYLENGLSLQIINLIGLLINRSHIIVTSHTLVLDLQIDVMENFFSGDITTYLWKFPEHASPSDIMGLFGFHKKVTTTLWIYPWPVLNTGPTHKMFLITSPLLEKKTNKENILK